MAFMTSLRDQAHKYALYQRTVRELRNLPTDYAVNDLGIAPSDARKIARKAVYGR